MGSNQCWLSKRIPSLLFLSMRQCNTIEHHGIKEEFDYTHLFKTDDDSYFNVDALYTELHTSQWWRCGCLLYKGIKGSDGAGKDHDYVGQCKLVHYEVHRELNTSGRCVLKPILNSSGFHDIAKEPALQFRKRLLTGQSERGTFMWSISNARRLKMRRSVCWPNDVILILSCHQPLSSRSIHINRTLQRKERALEINRRMIS